MSSCIHAHARHGAFVRAALLALVIAGATPSLRAADAAPGAAPTAVASPPAGAAAATTLYDVIVDLGRTDTLRQQVTAALRDTSDWSTLADRLDDPVLASDLKALEEGRDSLSRARYLALVDADTRVRERVRAVAADTATLGRFARKIEGELERLDRATARGVEWARLARELQAPAEIQRQAEAVAPEFAALRDALRVRRDQLLVAFQRGIALQARLDTVRATIAERRERIDADLRTFEDAPIWSAGALAFPRDEVAANVNLVRHEIFDYLRQHGARLGVLFAVLATLMFVVLRPSATSQALRNGAVRHSRGLALAGALLPSFIIVALIAPRAPFIFYRLIGFAVPLLAGVVATRSFAAPIPATAWALAFAVFVKEFRVLAEMSPGAARLLLAIELLPFAVALVHDWRRGALAKLLSRWRPLMLRRLVQVVLATLGVVVAASVTGYSGAAHALSSAIVIAPGYGVIFAAVTVALDWAFAGLLAIPLAQSLRSVRTRKDAILRTLHGVTVLFCWAVGVLIFTLAHSALDDLLHVANVVAGASVSAGDVTITFSAILSALLVVVVTWLVTQLVRFVLDHELLPRLDLRTGVPIAISTIVGYVLVVAGFVLAMAALGVDLTKVTLLAGAVGVGVGLGLQNVVNNFASGLILMLERPINVGDQIDVGGVVGEVRRIGVRSSTIRTGQGAEVIVPNADLASKQVTNWTLSDRTRRYEIDVGVAYGSDPAQVLRLLESAAATVPEVQQVPPPRALFTGFGESSLDFRLFAWVGTVDVGLQAQNGLRIAVLRALGEAGIEIPFPQRDLHIRHAADAYDPTATIEPVR